MAFFLVTHTSVVEADNEDDAASKVVDDIRAGGLVRVTVKSDEVTVTTVTVAAKVHREQSAGTPDGYDGDRYTPSGVEDVGMHKPDHPGYRLRGIRPIVTVVVLAALSLTLGYIQFHG